ncbi:MAG TPA: NB-ARC domain-containing protein, partial [Thermomicrobiaceae bacterium]|nr:NB-ARC domain-containing protein [Thermomicrobiaceae bacterium]
MAEGIALLRCDDLRLLTLTGLGGVGKTRLAIDLAHALETAYTHGATFVSLAALSNPELLPDTLLHTLGLQESSGRPSLESVKLALGAQQRLLVLDNFEQILPAAATVVDLLESCPQLTVLVTSRAPLHVRGEHLVIVPPLELDDAVVLFTERARALQANLVLTPADEAVVVDICRRLDGLPLAIELAAARGQELTPTALLAHLDRRLGLLTRGPRDLPSRQRTLRTTLEWSHELLPPGAQRLFRRLAVFRGGFTLAAAGAVDQCPGTEEVLALLGELVDYSLVQRRGERFAML